ncbi:MAG: hypothetical protein LBQ00_06210 [Syntrophobacterales bacterium]|jgi:hypothetical protein|nr:hypothetical protein [Syntrophobacterales bacterium]
MEKECGLIWKNILMVGDAVSNDPSLFDGNRTIGNYGYFRVGFKEAGVLEPRKAIAFMEFYREKRE